jgi:hypothetical protein
MLASSGTNSHRRRRLFAQVEHRLAALRRLV